MTERWTFQSFLEVTKNFAQKQITPLGFIDAVFNQAGRGDIVMFFADFVRGAQEFREFPVVGMELSDHVFCANGFLIVVLRRWCFAMSLME
ncbi:MAG TPA: hypothetical protein VIX91_12270 [Candidatus Acidoferrum sp.]